MKIQQIEISSIIVDEKIQKCEELNEDYIDELSIEITEGAVLPFFDVYDIDGELFLTDGFHRLKAFIKAGVDTVEANIFEVNERDAILHAVRARHPRTQEPVWRPQTAWPYHITHRSQRCYLKGEFVMVEKLESEVEKILEIGAKYLKKTGEPSSSAFFINPKRKYVVDPFDFSDKPKAKKLLKKMAKKHKATMVITITSALISKLKDSLSGPPYLTKEVIFSYGETKTDSFGICQEFECDKNGQIVFGKRIFFPVGTGSMTGFLCRKT